MDRSNWTIDDYVKELERLHELERYIPYDQWKLLNFYIEEEMKQKFDIGTREKYSLKF
jgi:hypothetical protein